MNFEGEPTICEPLAESSWSQYNRLKEQVCDLFQFGRHADGIDCDTTWSGILQRRTPTHVTFANDWPIAFSGLAYMIQRCPDSHFLPDCGENDSHWNLRGN